LCIYNLIYASIKMSCRLVQALVVIHRQPRRRARP
jgi:hypothetical protein